MADTSGVYTPPGGTAPYTRTSGEASGAGTPQPTQCPTGQRFNAQTQKCEATEQGAYGSQLNAAPTPAAETQIYDPQPNPAIVQPPPTASDDVWNNYYATTQSPPQGAPTDDPYAQQLLGSEEPPALSQQLEVDQQSGANQQCITNTECANNFGPTYHCQDGQCIEGSGAGAPPLAPGDDGGVPDDCSFGGQYSCADGFKFNETCQCIPDDGGGVCPDGSQPDARGNCPGTGTCPDGSAPDAQGNCPGATACPDGSLPDAQGKCPSVGDTCPDGSQPDANGMCPPHNPNQCGDEICVGEQICVHDVCTDPVGEGCVPSVGFGICLGGSRWNAQTNLCCHGMGGDPNIPFCPDGGTWHSTGVLLSEGYCAPKEEPYDSGAPDDYETVKGEIPGVDDRWQDPGRQANPDEPREVGDINFEDWMNVRGGGEGGYLDALKEGQDFGVGSGYTDALKGIAGQEGMGTEAEQAAITAMEADIDRQYQQDEERLIKLLNEQAELGGGFNSGARIDTIGRELGDLNAEKRTKKLAATEQMRLGGLEREITRQGQQIKAAGTGAEVDIATEEQQRKSAETWGGFDITEKENMMNFMLGDKQLEVEESLKRGELSIQAFSAQVAQSLGISEQQLQASGKDLEAMAMTFDYMLSKSSDERDWRNLEFGIDQFLMQMDFYRSQQLMNLISGIL